MDFNHPFGKEACKKRLLEEYHKYRKLIVAFDNTIFDYHNTGGDYSCVIELLKECSLLGFEMILFTTDDYKIMAKQTICMRLGIANITSNTLSAPNISSSIFSKSKKPYYNILLDDRSGRKL